MPSLETAQGENLVRQFFLEHWRTSLVAASLYLSNHYGAVEWVFDQV